jgi:hypothetical protein
VTINERSYIIHTAPNDAETETYPDAQAGHSPFYIGPLHGFAVGLNPNPNFHQAWYNMKGSNNTIAIAETPFFEDLKLIVTIARLGLADWRLIYSFLRCHHFIFEGTVSLDRRFTKTLKFFDEAALRAKLSRSNDRRDTVLGYASALAIRSRWNQSQGSYFDSSDGMAS